MTGFRILNAPSAVTNAAPFVEQARPDAGDFDAIAGGLEGTGVLTDCAVTFVSVMDVAVDSGSAVLAGVPFAVTGITLTIADADPTYDRIDLILASSGSVTVATGTPSFVPTWPTYAGNVVLAMVVIPAAATSLDDVNILDKRVFLAASTGGLPAWFLTSSTTGANGVPLGAVIPPTDDVPYLYWDDTTGSGLWITPPTTQFNQWLGLGRIANSVGPGLSFQSGGVGPFLSGRDNGVLEFAQVYRGSDLWELMFAPGGTGWATLGGYLDGGPFGALRLSTGDPNSLVVDPTTSGLCLDISSASTGIWQYNGDLATPSWVPYATGGGSGSGSPEGVLTGTVGQGYTDTDTGIAWRKISGSGTIGWGHGSGAVLEDPIVLGSPVDFITAGPLPSFTYDNGTAGVGATCTEVGGGALSVDGVAVTTGQRICMSTIGDSFGGNDPWLGIYDVTDPGTSGATPIPWILTRSEDCDTSAVLGSFWTVSSGPLGSGLPYARCLGFPYAPGPLAFTVGTDSLDVSVQLGNAFYSLAPLPGTTASGEQSLALGYLSEASGLWSIALGQSATASGEGSFVSGRNSTATALDAFASGACARAYETGQNVYASTNDSSFGIGLYQSSVLVGYAITTDATPTPTASASLTTFLIHFVSGFFPVWNRTMAVTARVTARRTDIPGTDSAWSFQGVCRGDGVGAYTWVGGSDPTPVLIAQDAAAAAWVAAITIGSYGPSATLVCTVTGDIGSTISWQCTLHLDEVAG